MSTKAERAQMEQLFEFNMQRLKELKKEVEETPYNFSAYAQMRYYEGICVGLKLAMSKPWSSKK